MTKAASAALNTHIGSQFTTLATCWKITRVDAVQFFFTDHDKDLVVSGDIYKAAASFRRSAIQTSSEMNVDDLALEGVLDSTNITDTDLRAGLFDDAKVEIFTVNWADLSQGIIKLRKGRLGEIEVGEIEYRTELRGLAQGLQTIIGDLYAPDCRVDLGSPQIDGCGVRLDPPAWTATTAFTVRGVSDANTGSVVKPTAENGRHFKCTVAGTSGASEPSWNLTIGGTTADGGVTWETIQALTLTGSATGFTDQRQFTDSARTEANDFWTEGLLTWTSGLNNGLKHEVKRYTLSGGTFELFLAMPFAIAVSDAYSVQAGCDKKLATCGTKFDNVFNFRGEPFVPGEDEVQRLPDGQ